MSERKPVFLSDIDRLGEWFWIEVEGHDTMLKRRSGNFAGVEKHILGWNVRTLGDIFRMEREVNYAPRVRYWRGEEPPTAEERRDGRWENESRLWMPSCRDMEDKDDPRLLEFLATGRTQWPTPPDPEDPVRLNRELAEKGEEPLAPMCAGCHFGKWKHGDDRRWYRTEGGNYRFSPCSHIGSKGWDWWLEYQEQPEECDGFCRIGEYQPSGEWQALAGLMRALLEREA